MSMDKSEILGKLEKEGVDLNSVILLGYRGSYAHGTYDKELGIDDIDLMGVMIPPLERYFGLTSFAQKEIDGELDVVIYELGKYVRLMLKCNPNVMSLLWLDPEYYLIKTELGQKLIDNRELFSSKVAYKSFSGYAYSQLKRMTHFNEEARQRFKELEDELKVRGIEPSTL